MLPDVSFQSCIQTFYISLPNLARFLAASKRPVPPSICGGKLASADACCVETASARTSPC